jgi:hypothetical protein
MCVARPASFRYFSGSLIESHYQLMTYEIPSIVLPIDTEGTIDLEYHRRWIEQRRGAEAPLVSRGAADDALVAPDNKIPRCIEQRRGAEAPLSRGAANDDALVAPDNKIPRCIDVLFGRDKLAQQHPGNIRYLDLVKANQGRYDAASSKTAKTGIANEIVVAIKSRGGQFLKRDGVGWVDVDDMKAKVKVTNTFRSRRKKILAKAKVLLHSW